MLGSVVVGNYAKTKRPILASRRTPIGGGRTAWDCTAGWCGEAR